MGGCNERHSRLISLGEPPVSFSVSQRTLEHLGWTQVLARLGGLTRTPGGRRAVMGAPAEEPRDEFPKPDDQTRSTLLETPDEAVAGLLEETAEALALLAEQGSPPLGGIGEISDALGHARKGGILTPRELTELGSTLTATRRVQEFIGSRT